MILKYVARLTLVVVLGMLVVALPTAHAQDPLALDAIHTLEDDAGTFNYPSAWSISYEYVDADTGSFDVAVASDDEAYTLQLVLFFEGELLQFGVEDDQSIGAIISGLAPVFTDGNGFVDAEPEIGPAEVLGGRDFAEFIVAGESDDGPMVASLSVMRLNEDYLLLSVAELSGSTDRAVFDSYHVTGREIIASFQFNESLFASPADRVGYDPNMGGNTDVAEVSLLAESYSDPTGGITLAHPTGWSVSSFSDGGLYISANDDENDYDVDLEPFDAALFEPLGIAIEPEASIVAQVAPLVFDVISPNVDLIQYSGVLTYEFQNGTYEEFIYGIIGDESSEILAFGILRLNNGDRYIVNANYDTADFGAYLDYHIIGRAIIASFGVEIVGVDATNLAVIDTSNATNLSRVGAVTFSDSYQQGIAATNAIVAFAGSDTVNIVDIANGVVTNRIRLQSVYNAGNVFINEATNEVVVWGSSAFDNGRTIEIHDLITAERLFSTGFNSGEAFYQYSTGEVGISADGSTLAGIADAPTGQIVVFDVPSRTVTREFVVENATGLTVIGDSAFICTDGVGDLVVTVGEYSLADGSLIRRAEFPAYSSCNSLTPSADGNVLALSGFKEGGSGENLMLLNVADFSMIWEAVVVPSGFGLPAFSPDGSVIAFPNVTSVVLFDVATGDLLNELDLVAEYPTVEFLVDPFVVFSPDGRLLVVKASNTPVTYFGVSE